jgi:hypothetical protein
MLLLGYPKDRLYLTRRILPGVLKAELMQSNDRYCDSVLGAAPLGFDIAEGTGRPGASAVPRSA